MALPVNGSTHLITAYYSFIDPERMKGWVGLVGWPVADGLPTLVVTHQLQVERRTGKVRRPETDVLPLCHATTTTCTHTGYNSFFTLTLTLTATSWSTSHIHHANAGWPVVYNGRKTVVGQLVWVLHLLPWCHHCLHSTVTPGKATGFLQARWQITVTNVYRKFTGKHQKDIIWHYSDFLETQRNLRSA